MAKTQAHHLCIEMYFVILLLSTKSETSRDKVSSESRSEYHR